MKLIQGDCLEVMRKFKNCCIDTIITDPPYALEFMGKGWDKVLPDVKVWKEALRVAKPGAFLLAFGGTRTYHRLTCAIEDAGWKIRDCIMWLYGGGFPKSLDISKQIDKRAGIDRKVVGVSSVTGNRKSHFAKERNDSDSGFYGDGKVNFFTAPATPEAQLWNGWGTALKPAYEPIVVAIKPIDGTFVNNALKWGVGGLNINGGRIGTKPAYVDRPRGPHSPLISQLNGQGTKSTGGQGRFPANLILDEKAAEMLDEQAGECKTGGAQKGSKIITDRGNSIFGKMYVNTYSTAIGEPLGGHSRFFYCAKASKAERGEENNHPTVKPLKLMEYLCKLTMTPTGGVVLDPFMGSGTTGVACKILNRVFVGIEKDPEYFEIAKKRIEGAD